MDFSLYWFMFPVSIFIALIAMLSGIGGAALFLPVFLLVFPLLGPEYMLVSPVAAIAVSLLTQVFGFSSGFAGYYMKQLIDFSLSKSFLIISIPTAITGALLSSYLNPTLIRAAYGVLVLFLAYVLVKAHDNPIEEMNDKGHKGNGPNEISGTITHNAERTTISHDGSIYQYKMYHASKFPTEVGGLLTGLLSVGIGEVVMPQLVKAGKVPVPVAAATSILVVIITIIFASLTHIVTLINAGGIDAIPWHLLAYTIPGVIIGGQIGPLLHGKVQSHTMEKVIAGIFIVIGIAMLWTVF